MVPIIQPRTTVVHVKDGFDVYIGRAMPGYPPSIFQNKFRVGVDGSLDEVIAKFELDLIKRLQDSPELRAALERLRGKRIGCWCKNKRDAKGKPKRCHGDVLVHLLEGPDLIDNSDPTQLDLF